ncbi:hypothetical protein F4678DRAFT_455288 [Xylaria arbuscula]|nr:hypothetical protein F4678DRAFT_455288 [Xylaria arbuscula]
MATENASPESAPSSSLIAEIHKDNESIGSGTLDGQETSEESASAEESDGLVLHGGWPTGMVCQRKNLYVPWPGFRITNWVRTTNLVRNSYFEGSDGEEDEDAGRYAVLVRKRETPMRDIEFIDLVIQSPHLVAFLQKALPNCPAVRTTGFSKQFPHLIFPLSLQNFTDHRRRLMEALDKEYDGETIMHIKLLQTVLHEEEKESFAAIRVAAEEGIVAFKDIWTIFKPECLLYTTYHDIPVAVRLVSTNYMHPMYGSHKFKVTYERLVWDGKQFGWATSTTSIPYFKGTMHINDLQCYPLSFHPDEERLMGEFLARGRQVVSFTGYHIKQYKGMTIGTTSRGSEYKSWMRNDERIVIDDSVCRASITRSQLNLRPLEVPSTSFDVKAENTGDAQQTDDSSDDDEWYHRNSFNLRKPHHLYKEHLVLCTPTIRGYSTLAPGHIFQFFVSSISDLSYDRKMIDRLVLPDNHKALLLSIARTGLDSDGGSALARGQRAVALLSGNPGTGKTVTAVAVAEYRQVPCLRVQLRGFDNYDEMELHLVAMFKAAERNKSVLLLVECDQAFKACTEQDMGRKRLVSALLGLIRTYEGLVFISIRAAEEIDYTFGKVISFHLAYPDLVETALKTWKGILDRETEHALDDMEITWLAKHESNGQNIRQVMNAAIRFANSEEEMLNYRHIAIVLGAKGFRTEAYGAEAD